MLTNAQNEKQLKNLYFFIDAKKIMIAIPQYHLHRIPKPYQIRKQTTFERKKIYAYLKWTLSRKKSSGLNKENIISNV